MKRALEFRFLHFLETDLKLPAAAIDLALKNHREDLNLLPVTLWKYRLITIDQVSALFDWFIDEQERFSTLNS